VPLEADREKVIASVRTPVALQKYQSETAVRLRAILGEFPARTPLNPKVAGRLERSGYTVEKLIFESRPRYYVTASVYVPRGRTGLFPGVICPHFVDHQAQRFFAFLHVLPHCPLANRALLLLRSHSLPDPVCGVALFGASQGRTFPQVIRYRLP
jgi:hypothetical protein